MREQRVSPEQFDCLQRAINLLAAQGYSPDAAIIQACRTVHIEPPKPFEGVNIVVDHALSSNERGGK